MLTQLAAAGTVHPANVALNLLIIVALLAVVLPLFRRFRRSVSAQRRARWAAEEQAAQRSPGEPDAGGREG